MKPTSPLQFGPRRWRAAWRARRVGGDGGAHKLEGELEVIGTIERDLEPIRGTGSKSDPVVSSELGAPPADDGPGQSHVERTVAVEMGHLAPAHPDRRDWSKRPFGNRDAQKSDETLDELLLHAIPCCPKDDERERKAN